MAPRCRECGGPVETELLNGEPLLCTQCRMRLAEEHVSETGSRPLRNRIPKNKVFQGLKWVIIGICLVITLLRLPIFVGALEKLKPLRQGTYATDAGTDACIQNLWGVAKALQEGRPHNLSCPVTGKPYGTATENGVTVVRCPNPGRHNLKELRVTNRNPVPEAIP